MNNHIEISTLCKVLSNPHKLTLFLYIVKRGVQRKRLQRDDKFFIAHMKKTLDLPQSTLSTYIKDLEINGLIETQKFGRYLLCWPKKEAFLILRTFVNRTFSRISV